MNIFYEEPFELAAYCLFQAACKFSSEPKRDGIEVSKKRNACARACNAT